MLIESLKLSVWSGKLLISTLRLPLVALLEHEAHFKHRGNSREEVLGETRLVSSKCDLAKT